MKKNYDRMTALICVLVGVIALLLLILFTSIKTNQVADYNFEYINREVEKCEEKIEEEYASTGKDPAQIERLYYSFLDEVTLRLKKERDVTFCSALYFDDRSGEDVILTYADREKYPVSKEACDYFSEHFFDKTLDLSFSFRIYSGNQIQSYRNEELIRKSALSSFTSYYGYFHKNCEYRFVFFFHPLKQVIGKYFLLYIGYLLLVVAMECGILLLRRRLFVGRRFKELMASTMTTGFSHELKTPLAILKASVENWDYIEDADKPRYLQKVAEETRHLDNLIEKLIHVSELDAGKSEIQFSEVNLYPIMMDAYEQLKPLIEERNLSVSFDTDQAKEYIVLGNQEMMRLAISNFISNAIKYSAHTVTIMLHSGKKIRFEVSNDGEGLSKEMAKKVWTLFYKTDKARTDRLGSSGVGLAVTKSILKAHKAKFGCTPDGNVTTFWFEMKRMKE